MADWDSDLYLRYQIERDRPIMDLIHSIGMELPARIIDIGCGPGNSTSLLKARWPDAEVMGIDTSPSMVDRAKDICPDATFIIGDASKDLSSLGLFDMVFANASLQWMPDHGRLVPRLFEMVRPNGVLAFQIPQYFRMPISRVIEEVAASERWAMQLKGAGPDFHIHSDPSYYEWLWPMSSSIRMWTTEYYHVMDGHEMIVDMMKSTGLRTYIDRIAEDEVPDLLASVAEGLRCVYPRQGDGRVLFPFKRLFVVARRGEVIHG